MLSEANYSVSFYTVDCSRLKMSDVVIKVKLITSRGESWKSWPSSGFEGTTATTVTSDDRGVAIFVDDTVTSVFAGISALGIALTLLIFFFKPGTNNPSFKHRTHISTCDNCWRVQRLQRLVDEYSRDFNVTLTVTIFVFSYFRIFVFSVFCILGIIFKFSVFYILRILDHFRICARHWNLKREIQQTTWWDGG